MIGNGCRRKEGKENVELTCLFASGPCISESTPSILRLTLFRNQTLSSFFYLDDCPFVYDGAPCNRAPSVKASAG